MKNTIINFIFSLFNKKISILLLIVISCVIFIKSPIAYAQTPTPTLTPNETAFQELVHTLNKDFDNVFTSYVNFMTWLEKNDDPNLIATEFTNNITKWNTSLEESQKVFKKYIQNADSNIATIANLGVSYTQKGIEACKNYAFIFEANTEDEINSLSGRGDQLFIEASQEHDKAVELYNNSSGVTATLTAKNILIAMSVIAVLMSIIVFIKSREKSSIQGEILRAEVYKKLFGSCLWMTGGLLVTTIGLVNAINNGGSYFIWYGPILFSGWAFLKGLIEYFGKGRRVLYALSHKEEEAAVKISLYEEKQTKIGFKKCVSCGSRQKANNIICTKCGENLL